MTTYIRTRNENKMQLNGDILTGDTYPIKDFIKTKLGGKWIADQKAWRVDVALVNKWLDLTTIYTDTAPATTQDEPVKGRMSYADFLRNADNPNSDY